MAITYVNIATQTLGTASASVTFSSIPSTYTDLVLRASVRTDGSGVTRSLYVQINSTTTGYSLTNIRGNGSAASSFRANSSFDTKWGLGGPYINAASSTSNTFSNIELYFTNYAGSTAKVASAFGAQENNSATAGDANVTSTALLNSNTGSITSLVLSSTAGNLVAGSSFYLYGIKNN